MSNYALELGSPDAAILFPIPKETRPHVYVVEVTPVGIFISSVEGREDAKRLPMVCIREGHLKINVPKVEG